MIELPETCVLVEQINQTIMGKRIACVVAGHTPHRFAWFTGDPADYHGRLSGRTITGARVYSGAVRIDADGMSLLISTPIRYHAPGDRLPEKHQLAIEFEDSAAISCTVQMWGMMCCYRTGDEASAIPAGHGVHDGPSPLDPAFDYDYFLGLLGSVDPSKTSAKAFLATEQRIPGLGNGVLQDILWKSNIHPKLKMAGLTSSQVRKMYDATKSVLAEMVAGGGRDTERDLFWRFGGYRTVLSKNTAGSACPVCGSVIRKEAYMGGSVYYCPQCQPV